MQNKYNPQTQRNEAEILALEGKIASFQIASLHDDADKARKQLQAVREQAVAKADIENFLERILTGEEYL